MNFQRPELVEFRVDLQCADQPTSASAPPHLHCKDGPIGTFLTEQGGDLAKMAWDPIFCFFFPQQLTRPNTRRHLTPLSRPGHNNTSQGPLFATSSSRTFEHKFAARKHELQIQFVGTQLINTWLRRPLPRHRFVGNLQQCLLGNPNELFDERISHGQSQ